MRSFAGLAALPLLLASPAAHGVCSDADSDLVCDSEDNCRAVANGPLQLSNQADSDLDGYGNRCDTDFDDSRTTTTADFAVLIDGIRCGTDPSCVPPPGFCELDLDGDLTAIARSDHFASAPPPPPATLGDFALHLVKFASVGSANAPGPSGLVCAGTTPCGVPAAIDPVGWVVVDSIGNETAEDGHGRVDFVYRMSPREVTNADYVKFLNAAAREDALGLYNPAMAGSSGGILRTGSSGSYVYTAVAGREARPVNFVSFFDALRFVNWLENGQHVDIAVTYVGSYVMNAGAGVARGETAHFVLPSEDEWYKSAYYDAGSSQYFEHATGSDLQPSCVAPESTSQAANCGDIVGESTPVGAYLGSASPWGTFDQAGNVAEWTETASDDGRVVRGGDYTSPATEIGAAARAVVDPETENERIGFRVARRVTPCWP